LHQKKLKCIKSHEKTLHKHNQIKPNGVEVLCLLPIQRLSQTVRYILISSYLHTNNLSTFYHFSHKMEINSNMLFFGSNIISLTLKNGTLIIHVYFTWHLHESVTSQLSQQVPQPHALLTYVFQCHKFCMLSTSCYPLLLPTVPYYTSSS